MRSTRLKSASEPIPAAVIADRDGLNRPLDRTSPLPLYAQIKQRLIGLIASWDEPDRRFYSDEQLCAFFCVSRDTVRQAVSELVREGLLTRSRGLGTFVAVKKLRRALRAGHGLHAAVGGERNADSVDASCLRTPAGADETIAASLEIDIGASVLMIKRTRSAARVPVAIDYRYLPADLVSNWDETAARGSPLHLLWQRVESARGRLRHRGRHRWPGRSRIFAPGAGRSRARSARCAIAMLASRSGSSRVIPCIAPILSAIRQSVPLSREGTGTPARSTPRGLHND